MTKKSKKPKKNKLNAKQLAFCREYLIDRNATEAAKRAGYSKKTAYSQGQRLLKNVEIQNKIKELEKPIVEKLEITAEMVVKGIANIAFFDPAKLYDENGNLLNIHDMPVEARQVLAGLDVYEEFDRDGERIGQTKKAKYSSQIKALELLGKLSSLGLFSENHNHTVKSKFADLTDEELEKRIKELGG